MKRSHSRGGRDRHSTSNHNVGNHRGRQHPSQEDERRYYQEQRRHNHNSNTRFSRGNYSGDWDWDRSLRDDRNYRDTDEDYRSPRHHSEFRGRPNWGDMDYGFDDIGSGGMDNRQRHEQQRGQSGRGGIDSDRRYGGFEGRGYGGDRGYGGFEGQGYSGDRGYSGLEGQGFNSDRRYGAEGPDYGNQRSYSHRSAYGGQRGMPNENEYSDLVRGNRTETQGFEGRGPKGYRRSDERIEEDVSEMLMYHPEVDATNIEVKVEDGEVTLSGSVNDRRTKRLAEDIADQCNGVVEVHNHIHLQRSGGYDREVSRQTETDRHSPSRSSKSTRSGEKTTARSGGEDKKETSPGLQSRSAKDSKQGTEGLNDRENKGMDADQSP